MTRRWSTAITGWTRAEATVASHRMAAIAELTDRRGASEQAIERQFWACDAWDCAAAEIAAASGISARMASRQMHQALALAPPPAAGRQADGRGHPVAAVGAHDRLAHPTDRGSRRPGPGGRRPGQVAGSFGALSVAKLESAIDAAITVHDPAAVRRFQTAAKGVTWSSVTVTTPPAPARCGGG